MAPHSPSLTFRYEGKSQVVPYIYDLTYDHRIKNFDIVTYIFDYIKDHVSTSQDYHIDHKVINAESETKSDFGEILVKYGFKYVSTRTSNKTGKQYKCYTWQFQTKPKKESLLFEPSKTG
jgi:hypothetical protein